MGPQLAAGDPKGNVMMYNRDTRKKTSIVGKHSSTITCGAWNKDNTLALGSSDRTFSLSNADGDFISQPVEVRHPPLDISFARQKIDGNGSSAGAAATSDGSRGDSTVSINMDGKILLLYDMFFPEKPVELAFQSKYGDIVKHQWYGDGYLALGFAEGYVVVISTHMNEVTEELFSGHFHVEGLQDIAYSAAAHRVASAGTNTIKMVDASTWKQVKEDATVLDASQGDIVSLSWTSDGQILTVATSGGYVLTYLARLPDVSDSHENRVAFMSSLKEVRVVDTSLPADDPSAAVQIPVGVEPAFLALGPHHIAVGMNNIVEFKALDRSGSIQQTYVGTVDEVRLGPYHAAVRSGGKVYLHAINAEQVRANGIPGGDGMTVLPGELAPAFEGTVTCIAMTRTFLMWGTANGNLGIFSVPDWKPLDANPYKHPKGQRAIVRVFPNGPGTRVLLTDSSGEVNLFNPVNGLVLSVPDPPSKVTKGVWDTSQWGLFALSDGGSLRPYLHVPLTVTGAAIKPLGSAVLGDGNKLQVSHKNTPLPEGTSPISMTDGVCLCTPAGGASTSVQRVTLTSHRALASGGNMSTSRRRELLAHALALCDVKLAWSVASELQDTGVWVTVANHALEVLDVETATRVYRAKGDAGMVVALEEILAEEDQALVAGHIAVLFGNFQLAQELYLSSGRPAAALHMHRDLQQFEQAMSLAENLAPHLMPELSIEYGKQLEFKGQYGAALGMYQQADLGVPREEDEDTGDSIADAAEALLGGGSSSAGAAASGGKVAEEDIPESLAAPSSNNARLRRAIHEGITRCLLRTGDLRKGMGMALEPGFAHRSLVKDAALILESIKQIPEASKLYARAGLFDKAASLLLGAKNFKAATPLMAKVTAARLHAQFAKAMEATHDYVAAAQAYERARDLDAVVRLLVDHLGHKERAGDIVRQTRSIPAALHLSRTCQSEGNMRGAIEFLLIAQKPEEAFGLAMSHDEMELYVKVLKEFGLDVTPEDYGRIAGYYEGKQDWAAAGRYFVKAENDRKALMYFLKCGTAEVDAAIAVVGAAKDKGSKIADELTHRLIDHLTGEAGGVQHDPRSIFKLYLALGKHARAGDTALVIARTEQDTGKYGKAHDTLLEAFTMLAENGVRVPSELARTLELLHSYILVKRLVALGDHTGAAHMLKRVVSSLSQFEKHSVQILTSAVIECQRAGLKKSSFQLASQLMRPENRDAVKPEFRRKIEALVRRPKDEEAETERSPCPVCGINVPVYTLDCPSCRSHIPQCIASGKHMTISDWTQCPHCTWPALQSDFGTFLGKHPECPMCNTAVPRTSLSLVTDPQEELRRCMAMGQKEAEEDGEASPGASEGKAADGAAAAGTSGAAEDSPLVEEEEPEEPAVSKRPKPQLSGAAAVLGAMGL